MFKERLKELRMSVGLTQQELADQLFVSRSAVCKWEMGNGIPSEVNLEALCTFFKVDEVWLLDRQDLKDGLTQYESQFRTRFSHGIGIVLPVVFFWLSTMPYFTFGHGDELIIALYVPPRSLVEILNYYFMIPSFVWLGTCLFSIFQKKRFGSKKEAKIHFAIHIALIVISSVFFIASCIVANKWANQDNFWFFLFNS